MFKNHEQACSKQIGQINVKKMRIDLTPNSKPLVSPKSRAGPSTREFEQAEIAKMLKEGFMKPSMSEWATAVLVLPKKDGKLHLCTYMMPKQITSKDS